MRKVSSRAGPFKPPQLSPLSSGTVFDGGWHAWWQIESRRAGTDWRTLLESADQALRRLRVPHSSEWRS